MTNASIEDLLGKKKKDDHNEPSTQDKFQQKMDDIAKKRREAETQAKASAAGFEYISLEKFPISQDALSLIPRQQANDHKVISFLAIGSEVRLGAVNPKDPALDEIKYQLAERTHANIKIYAISELSFSVAEKGYDTLPEIKPAAKGVALTKEELDRYKTEIKQLSDLNDKIQKVTVTDFLAVVVAGAVNNKSSDIHIEAEEKVVIVRYRIDGVLQNVASVPHDNWNRIVSRIKLISGLKLTLTTVPQDGRFTIFVGPGQDIDVRVSTLPTAYGESIVMRLLMPGTIGLSFDDLGIRGRAFEQLKREVERPNGMIITTGPTGSGKTTTLYAVLKKLNDPETKIVTLEDPIEYRLEGVNQSQIDKSKDYTFAKGLTSILRQDPDVIMVGEIRELETAEVAIQAALTGHLMLSTIHTNSASGAIPRFLSMGVKPFLLAPSLNAVIGQRLVRKIHDACKQEAQIEESTLTRVKDYLSKLPPNSGYSPDLNNLKFFKGAGCEACNNSGYKGRMGIYEIFTMSKDIEKVILSGNVSEYEMQDIAIKQGMITMAQDGILKAIDGITTIEEVFKVTE
jgi:type IV pilus assembly protein PilB